MLDTLQYVLGALSGGLVGFSLGLVGGGGSILAVPLMVYLVGVPSPHMAIGTSALAVAVNAATGLVSHARAHTVKWRCGGMYAARSEEHTSELPSLMRISYAVFSLKKKNTHSTIQDIP